MEPKTPALVAVFLALTITVAVAQGIAKDVVKTSKGNVEISFLGHGSLLLAHDGKQIYLDPFSRVADYTKLPKADLILITHGHRDHLDPDALGAIRTASTLILAAPVCAGHLDGAQIMQGGDEKQVLGVTVTAVPAYNIVNTRPDGQPFHPKGEGIGFILAFGDTRIYVAGDTENTPEMKALKDITIAFLPMNLPYTMTPEMLADAVRAFRPRILYPYHTGETDVSRLTALLAAEKGIEIRLRSLK
jgi:L-ascorbate metabolism protein UlaG (beta-lactamase superfamily)